MVYGGPLTFLGDLVPKTANRHSNADPQLPQPRDWVRTFAPVPTSQHGMVPSHVPHNLQDAKFVFFVGMHTIHPSNDLMKALTMSSSLAQKPLHATSVARVNQSQ